MKKLTDLNLKNKKYIIFDMDGTLIDSIGVWNRTDQKLIEKYGNKTLNLESIQIERDTFLHSNQSSDIYLAYCEYLIKKYNLTIKDSAELLRIRWNISGEVLEKEMDFKPHVVELIKLLRHLKFTLILATMTTQVQLDIYSKKNKKMLSQLNITEAFDLITRKEDVLNKKPDPEIYLKIMKYYNAKPEECLIFEDSYTGVLASNNAKIEVVNIYDKYADVDREKIANITDYSIHDYKEFINLVNNLYKQKENIIETTLTKVFSANNDKRICVLGTTCTGKSTLIKKLGRGLDMDSEIFPLLTAKEKDYVCKTPWTEEVGAVMDNLVRERIVINKGNPLFGTVLLPCDMIIYLHINDDLLLERTKLRNASFTDAKNMQAKIEEEIKNSGIETITLEV